MLESQDKFLNMSKFRGLADPSDPQTLKNVHEKSPKPIINQIYLSQKTC
jgi:hypothetical protein